MMLPMLHGLLSSNVKQFPLSLFQNGEQGAWYDPSDLSTLFQDAAGIIPVTADGDPVGLMLDKHMGLVRGPTLIDNLPDFESTWELDNVSGDASIVGNVLTFGDHSGDSLRLFNAASIPDGAWVQYTARFRKVSENPGEQLGFRLNLYDGTESNFMTLDLEPGVGSWQTKTIIARKRGTMQLQVRGRGVTADGLVLELDPENTTLRELPGNHATQSTTAAKPTYRTDGTLHWLEFDGVDDSLAVPIWPAAFTQHICACAIRAYSGAGVGEQLTAVHFNGNGIIISQEGDQFTYYNGNLYTFFSDPVPIDQSYVLSTSYNGTDHDARVNSVVGASYEIAPQYGTNGRSIGCRFAGSLFFNGPLYGVILVDEYTQPGLIGSEKYLAAKAGVTLP